MNAVSEHIREIEGMNGRSVRLTINEPTKRHGDPVVFLHGYKGFSQWGAWHLVAEEFAELGIPFIRVDFSHNGTTNAHPQEFIDKEAFGENRYSWELEEAMRAINWVSWEMNAPEITLIGHSRGGGIAILAASQNQKIARLITWAAVRDFEERFPQGEERESWMKEGVYHVVNGRTGEQLPHYTSFLEDYNANQASLDIEQHARTLDIPWLIVHGSDDPAVSIEHAEDLLSWSRNAHLFEVEGSDHVFGSKHPWEKQDLPGDLDKVTRQCIRFITESDRTW